MRKEAELFFSIPVGTNFWGLVENYPIIVALFLPIVTHREWGYTWNVRGRDLASGTIRALQRELKNNVR